MNLPENDLLLLRDWVKTTRQKPYSVAWKDRDGTDRLTTLTNGEVVRLNKMAQQLKVSKSEVMRLAAHIPVPKLPAPPPAPDPAG